MGIFLSTLHIGEAGLFAKIPKMEWQKYNIGMESKIEKNGGQKKNIINILLSHKMVYIFVSYTTYIRNMIHSI